MGKEPRRDVSVPLQRSSNSRTSSAVGRAGGTQAHSCTKETPKKGAASKWRSQLPYRIWGPGRKNRGRSRRLLSQNVPWRKLTRPPPFQPLSPTHSLTRQGQDFADPAHTHPATKPAPDSTAARDRQSFLYSQHLPLLLKPRRTALELTIIPVTMTWDQPHALSCLLTHCSCPGYQTYTEHFRASSHSGY